MERLQKVIANSGYCSRRNAEELILAGKVYVNDKKVIELGTKVSGTDKICVEGQMLNNQTKEYVLLYKPRSYVSTTSDDKNRKTILDLIKTNNRLYPIGRLDYDTTGIIILTNDGELTNILTHPKNEIEKTYVAKVKGIFLKEQCITMSKGIIIDGYKTSKCFVKTIKVDKKNNCSYVEIIIHEGKYHQVKKMFDVMGYEVLKLKREKYAFLTLDSLKPGEYRYLSIKEVKKLYSLKK